MPRRRFPFGSSLSDTSALRNTSFRAPLEGGEHACCEPSSTTSQHARLARMAASTAAREPLSSSEPALSTPDERTLHKAPRWLCLRTYLRPPILVTHGKRFLDIVNLAAGGDQAIIMELLHVAPLVSQVAFEHEPKRALLHAETCQATQ